MTAQRTKIDGRLLDERRKLGAFYTPERLSDILSAWTIRSKNDFVLEPSFGGCGFLQSARSTLTMLGCDEPRRQIYGCDIDPIAFEYLANVFGAPVDLERFVKEDFLQLTGDQWSRRFEAILANPPYIPYQNIDTAVRQELSSRNHDIEGVGGRASLWAYFIAHAVSFLADNGRMAWVLPGAFLQADYAKPIRKYLRQNFRRSAAFIVRERLFLDAGTDEETIVLLADGHKRGAGEAETSLGEAKSLSDLSDLIAKWDDGSWHGDGLASRPAMLSLTSITRQALNRIEANSSCKELGSIAKVQIGVVTGANEFFVLSDADRISANLEISDCTKIMSKFQSATGLDFTKTDHVNMLALGGRGYLVDTFDRLPNSRIEDYLDTFGVERREKVSTFKKRAVWSEPDDRKLPDAFFPVMHHYGPRIVMNEMRCSCTNTIHRLYFLEGVSVEQQRLASISILTSFSQLSSELVGRRYGSGVLKHEPREAEKIKMLLPQVDPAAIMKTFRAANSCLRKGDREGAMNVADSLIFPSSGIIEWQNFARSLKIALSDMRQRRRPQSRQKS